MSWSEQRTVTHGHPQPDSRVRFTRTILGCAAAVCVVVAVVITAIEPHIFALGLFLFSFGPLLIWYTGVVNRRAVRIVRSGVFYRAEGPLKIERDELPTLRVGAVRMRYSNQMLRAIKGLKYAAADYTERGEDVIEIRDEQGEVRYRMPGYTP